MRSIFVIWISSFFIIGSADCSSGVEQEKEMSIGEYVPIGIAGWKAEEPDGHYINEEIFRYMDGAGEVYLSYSFKELFVRQFIKEGKEPLTVELYDMGSAVDAFGVFTRGRQGGDVGVGQGSDYSSGYLIFWKNKYLVAVYTIEETPENKALVFELGMAIAQAIPGEGELPDLLELLPAESRVPGSERYFHKHTCLNHHYFLADENILGLDESTDAAMAEYDTGDERAWFLLVRYPESGRAGAAYKNFIDLYMPEGRSTGMARLENGRWTAVSLHGDYLLAVFDAFSEGHAEGLLASVRANLEGRDHDR